MKIIDKTKVKRILVVTLSNIGDVILTTPVVEALLRAFPGASLDVLVGPNGKELFEAHEKISECVIYNKRASTFAKLGLVIKLFKKRYDLLMDLKHTALPLFLFARYNSPAVRRDKNLLGRKAAMHKKDIHLSRLAAVGIDISGWSFHIPIKESDKKYIDDILKILGDKPFLAVSPSAKSHVKRWPLKNFATLCDRIKNELGYEVILIGDKNDRIVIERTLFYMATKPVNLIEKTNIRQLAYLVKKSKLLITNDSAPLHVGSAVDASILAFFGPTDEKKYGPATKGKSIVMRKDLKCSPCEVPQCINLENKYECLKTISVEEAFEAVKKLLN